MALDSRLTIVVGSGGVGKTTLAAALGLRSAAAGFKTLVMTFDPSRRLKDALGIEDADANQELAVQGTEGRLYASLLDARATFDSLVERYAEDDAARQRILSNSYYSHLAGHLGGILEYMAVERLYEVASDGGYQRIILDTPPTAQAIDFLEAPQRIVDFLDSGALKIALAPWFADDGTLKATSRLSFVGRSLEQFLDRIVGLQLLRDMSEFFRAFGPLFPGFRQRASETEQLLGDEETRFVLVTGAGADRIPDTLFFARKLEEAGYRLGPVVVNRVHPEVATEEDEHTASEGRRLLRWLGERHRRGLVELQALLRPDQTLVAMPLAGDEPTDLAALDGLGQELEQRWHAALRQTR
ncbi:MAG: ArsA-related P-loop ATPase [Acidobacteriota bacterium]